LIYQFFLTSIVLVGSDTPVRTLEGLFNISQVVKIRIIEVRSEDRILVASILKADTTDFVTPEDFAKLEIGHTVSGQITDIHKDNAVLKLQPSHIQALLSINNIANHRGVSVAQIRGSLKINEEINDLMVVSKNPSKNLAIVAIAAKQKPKVVLNNSSLPIESLSQGQIISGIVVKHSRKGSVVRLGKRVFGTLHPTDAVDDYSSGTALPQVDTVLRAVILAVDPASHQVILSTRSSKLGSDSKVVDPEISKIQDLKPGQAVRGFVKSVIDHGLFVSLSRNLDARVQIKELFNEVSIHPNNSLRLLDL
jgi:rRNA biogenesis protein RRP5